MLLKYQTRNFAFIIHFSKNVLSKRNNQDTTLKRATFSSFYVLKDNNPDSQDTDNETDWQMMWENMYPSSWNKGNYLFNSKLTNEISYLCLLTRPIYAFILENKIQHISAYILKNCSAQSAWIKSNVWPFNPSCFLWLKSVLGLLKNPYFL